MEKLKKHTFGKNRNNSVKDSKPRKVRNRLNQSEFFYTYSHWDRKEIEGIKFLAVVKDIDPKKSQQVYYVREDNMEFVK